MIDSPDTAARPRPVVLCILDGWGYSVKAENNAIHLAETPVWDHLVADWPTGRLDASALEVGLPQGQMGNSEVGHMNLGAGRVVMQELPRIDKAIADGALDQNPELTAFVKALKSSGGVCHLLGLLSLGGVHSHRDHMVALARIVAAAGVPVRVHGFLDGRDTPPKAAKAAVRNFLDDIDELGDVRLATVTGRYFAMDRDSRWDRVETAYGALVDAAGERVDDPVAYIEQAYAAGETDEFIRPAAIGDYAGMQDGDGLLMANFRADRARQLLTALAEPAFDGFARTRTVDFAARLGMVEYSAALAALFPALFPPQQLDNLLGQVVSEAGLTQLRCAETEKYAHVTFFLNGGREEVFEGEERILVPSPKVATYDLKPEMSAVEITDALVAAIEAEKFDLIVVNYANGDMVGHTGILEAAIEAAEVVDACLGRLEKAVVDAGGVMLVTADHGNCEQMVDPDTGEPHTAHTLNLVPAVLVNAADDVKTLADGRLADVAPTLLELLRLPKPEEMSGRSLIVRTGAERRAAE